MRVDGGNHHEKLALKRILCASHFIIPDTAGNTPDPVGKYPDTRSSTPNEASGTLTSHIRSYPPYHSHLQPSSLFLFHYRRTQS